MERNQEQVAFYKSSAWQRARYAYGSSRDWICERCGRAGFIVHHRQHITPENVGDPSVTLNPENLEVLCQTCHNQEHFGKGVTARGLKFDGDGNIVAI